MALPIDVNYTDGVVPAVSAAWLNGTSDWVNGAYSVFGSTYTATAFQAALDTIKSNFRAGQTGASQSIPALTFTLLIFNTEEYDDLAEYNPVTGLFTAAATGTYHFDTAVFGGGGGPPSSRTLYLYVNGVKKCDLSGSVSEDTASPRSGSATIKLTAGDTVGIYIYVGTAGGTLAFAVSTWFCGYRVK